MHAVLRSHTIHTIPHQSPPGMYFPFLMVIIVADLRLRLPAPASAAPSAAAIHCVRFAAGSEQRLHAMDAVLASLRAASDRLFGSYEFCHDQNVTYAHRVDDPSETLHVHLCGRLMSSIKTPLMVTLKAAHRLLHLHLC